MRAELLDYYRDNLQYLRVLAGEFAAEYPKIAGRLSINEFDCEDPYIERLLEGTAFLSARVEKKLDDSYFPLVESVLNSVAPNTLCPIPAGVVVEAAVNAGQEGGSSTLPAKTVFDANIPRIKTPCRFTTPVPLPMTPFAVSDAAYVTRDLEGLGIRAGGASSALHIKITAAEKHGAPSVLRFYVNLSESEASHLQRQVLSDRVGVYIKEGEGDFRAVPPATLAFSLPIPVDPGGRGNTYALRIFENFLAYPAFFKFFSIERLDTVLPKTTANFELLLTFSRRETTLASEINAAALKLNCFPALNVFDKQGERTALAPHSVEFHVVPDRTAMRDYEVLRIRGMEFFDERNTLIGTGTPFYAAACESRAVVSFSPKRRRKVFERKTTARSSYECTEVFVSLSAPSAETAAQAVIDNAAQFSAALVCTNRDLPLLVSQGAQLTSTSTVTQKGRILSGPTRPRYPLVEGSSAADLERLGHITFNMNAMLWETDSALKNTLTSLLRNYPLRTPEEMEKMVDGIAGVKAEKTLFRFTKRGNVFYESGWRLNITLNENSYAGMGWYVFGSVLEKTLRSFAPLNSFLEITLSTVQSGLVETWTP